MPHGCQARAPTDASNLLLVPCYETTTTLCMCTLVIKLHSVFDRAIITFSSSLSNSSSLSDSDLLPATAPSSSETSPFFSWIQERETVWVECIANNLLFQILVIWEKDWILPSTYTPIQFPEGLLFVAVEFAPLSLSPISEKDGMQQQSWTS